MSELTIKIARGYYTSMGNKDLNGLGQFLHQDAQLTSPFVQVKGKDSVLATVQKFMGYFQKLTIRTTLGSENQAAVVYDVDCGAPIGVSHCVALLTIKDGLVSSVELFFDTGPFKKT